MDNLSAAIVVTIIGCILQTGIFDNFKVPLVAAPIVGIALGDPVTGILMGAELQLIFMGATAVGASVPPNATVGSIIATALMIQSGQPMEAALALAVPVAVAGQSMNILNRAVCTFIQHIADKFIKNKKYWGVDFSNYLGLASKFIMYIFIFFPAVYFGSSAVEALMDVIPKWVLHGLEVAGGILPIVGFGMLLKYLNIKYLFPFFFIGFCLSTFGGFSMIGATIVAVCVAGLMDYFTNGFTIGGGSLTPQTTTDAIGEAKAVADDLDALMDDDDDDVMDVSEDKMEISEASPTATTDIANDKVYEKIVKKKDLFIVFVRSFLLQIAWNFERMQGLGFCYCILPVLKKIYKNNPEKLQFSIQRHNEFFNTNPLMSDFILGTTIAMEENVSAGGEVDELSINTVKVSLMGPLAGIGDSLYFFTIIPILQGICISFSKDGSFLGPIVFLIAALGIEFAIRWFGVDQGYKLGVGFVEKLSSGVMQRVTSVATIIGLIVVGVMTATMVKVPLIVEVGVPGATKPLMDIFNSFMPNLLPLIFTLTSFFLIKKGVSATKILFGVIIISVLAALAGIV